MRRFSIFVVAIVAAACSSHSTVVPAPTNIQPEIFQKQPLTKNGWTKFLLNAQNPAVGLAKGIAVDANQNVWVTAYWDYLKTGTLVKIAMDKTLAVYPLTIKPWAIAIGPDHDLWLSTAYGDFNYPGVIARVSPTGVETDFTVSPGMFFSNIITGPDGALWFSACSADQRSGGFGRITTGGSYKIYPTICSWVIANGPDGNIWYGGNDKHIYKITTHGVLIGKYLVGERYIFSLTAGPDDALYAIRQPNSGPEELIRVTTSGTVSHLGPDEYLDSLGSTINGPDGNLWISARHRYSNYLVTFDPHTSTWVSRIKGPAYWGIIIIGPDSNIWETDSGRIDIYVRLAMKISPRPLRLRVGQTMDLNVAESNYIGQWSAQSSSPAIATITPNSNGNTFVVNGVTPGTARITVYDSMFNSVAENVTVR